MGKGFLLLVLNSAVMFISAGELAAQQRVRVVSGSPIEVVSKDGTKRVSVEVILSDKDIEKIAVLKSAMQTKSKKRNAVTSKSSVVRYTAVVTSESHGERRTTVAETENKGKLIKYGPWRMLNNFKIPAYSFADNFNYTTKDKAVAGGGSVRKQIKAVKPDLSSLLELSQNAQIKVVQGQLYSVQVGHFTFNNSAVAALQKISATTNMPVLVIIKNGFYSLLIEGFQNWNDAKLFVGQLDKLGYKGTIVKINTPGKVGSARI